MKISWFFMGLMCGGLLVNEVKAMLFTENKLVTTKTWPQHVQKALIGATMIQKACEVVVKGELKKLDGSIGDKNCHVLTAAITDLSADARCQKEILNVHENINDTIKDMKKMLHEKSGVLKIEQKKGINFLEFLDKNGIHLPSCSKSLHFLAAVYFLATYSSVGNLAPNQTIFEDGKSTLEDEFPLLGKKNVIALLKSARKEVNTFENEYIKDLSKEVAQVTGFSLYDTHYSPSKMKADKFTPEFDKKIPDFCTFELLLAKKKKPYAIALDIVCDKHENKVVHPVILGFKPTKEGFEPVDLAHVYKASDSCHTTQGFSVIGDHDISNLHGAHIRDTVKNLPKESHLACEHAKEKLKELSYITKDVETWIFAGAADHMQGFAKEVDTSGWKEEDIAAFNKKISFYKEKAALICSPKTGIFPRHDVPCTVGELTKKGEFHD